tara:strand:+ start:73 stop:696 length:624 start_codon:yes stop_codon:yes gene_type:complete
MSIIKLSNNGVKNATAFGSVGSGAMTFIKKLTASSSATLSFVDGSSSVVLDNTYKEYFFTFKNIHPSADGAEFRFQANASGGSGYNETITSTQFQVYHKEDGSASGLNYNSGNDQAQGTSFQNLNGNIDGANDACGDGYLHLFNPSSTTFVKHFMAVMVEPEDGSPTPLANLYTAGYFNTTSAIDEIQFKMSSGNIDAGDICLYGIA